MRDRTVLGIATKPEKGAENPTFFAISQMKSNLPVLICAL